jgi:hypothetical protein
MSVHEIIAELPKLSEEERELILRQLVNLDQPFEATPAMEVLFWRVSAHYVKRRLIPPQKCALGSPHGLRGNLFRDRADRFAAFIATDNAEAA